MRIDKKKNISKVAKVVLNEPLLTRDEIAIKAWVWQWTASRALEELEQTPEYQKLLKEASEKTKILSEDFKKEINNEVLSKFITKAWWNRDAMMLLEKYMMMYIWEKLPQRNITTNKRYEVLKRAWFKCQACWEKPNECNDIILHIDHINPASLGWSNNLDNLQVLCDKCNISKWKFYNINHNYE